jgi:HlyD family secretion protein
MAGTEIMTIANLSRMEVSVDVSENDIVRIQKGDTSILEIDAFPKKKFMGRVREIANATALSATGAVSADQVTNYTVKISIDPASYAELRKTNPRPLLPGMSASVEIRTDRASQALSIPIVAVTSREQSSGTGEGDDKTKDSTKVGKQSAKSDKSDADNKEAASEEASEAVFVYSNGKVKLVPVKTGLQDDEFMTIISGLKGDEEVVIAPFSAISKTLKDGAAAQKVAKDQLFEDAKE